jgi:tetratricopeptide (TPR) repeat protein
MARSRHAHRRSHSRVSAGGGARQAARPPSDIVRQLLQQGVNAQAVGDFARAATCYREALAQQPGQPDALHLLGTISLSVGDVDTAEDLLKRAVATKGSDPALRINLANALIQKRDTKTAEVHLRKALKLDPGNPAARCFLANCRSLDGDARAAREIYEAVLSRHPEHPQATLGCADVCLTLGELNTARGLYRKVHGWGTAPALALAGLAACEKLAADSTEAVEIERWLRRPGLKAVEYIGLRYAAGRIAEDAGRYDEAFEHFAEAKRLGGVRYDIEATRRTNAAFESLFTRDFFADRKGHGDPTTRPIFVVGMPRSGTTLTEQILSSHPDVAGAGELGDITLIAGSLGFHQGDLRELAKRVRGLTPADIRKLAKRYLTVLDGVSNTALHVVDKMPDNYRFLGLIALMFPNAKIIHCRRDPLDTCMSCFTTPLVARNHAYAADLTSLGLHYREYMRLMQHWQSVLPSPMFESSYELMTEEPEQQSRQLVDFVGLPWDPACLSFHEQEGSVQTISRVQVRQPLYRSSVGRWRRYDSHLAPLKSALGDLVTPG